MENITVNEKKVKDIEVDGKTYERYAIKTHVRVEFYSKELSYSTYPSSIAGIISTNSK